MTANKTFINFSGGEVSPDLRCRIDVPIHDKVLERCRNFITNPKGKATFRPGFRYVHHTRNHNYAVFIEFQFSDVQAYLVEATEGYFRFYKDEGIILNASQSITGISQANPGVLTYSGADNFSNGQEVYIEGVVGMTEVNGRYFTVANVNTGANTFQLTDEFGNNINTSGYTAYSSGGTVATIYEITTPYQEEDLDELAYDQNADTMYIVHTNYAPRKLTRLGHTSWTLATYTRTADPFPSAATITGVDISPPTKLGILFAAGHSFTTGTLITITGVGGMTQLNGNTYSTEYVSSTKVWLVDRNSGAYIDATTYGTYTSGGTATPLSNPAAVAFTQDARTVMGGSQGKPETLYFSRSPSNAGAVRYDDYTTGTAADNAAIFTLAPLRGKVDSIRYLTNTDKFLIAGTFGSVRRIFGEAESQPITPTAISAKSANSDGVARRRPVVDGATVMHIQRSTKAVEGIEYDYRIDGYAPDDKNLISGHLAEPGLINMSKQSGSPTITWVPRVDGKLLGLTYEPKENIAGWHLHTIGGVGAQAEWVGVMSRESNEDQAWIITKRTVNGNTVRHVEFLTDYPTYPEMDDFYGVVGTESGDITAFHAYQWEQMKQAVHLDSSLTYDGSAYGADASATLTPGAGATTVNTTGVTFTASAAVFTSSMVGREIWGKFDNAGGGGGRATITGYSSTTVVTATITKAFPSGEVYAAGDWYLTTTSITGLHHLEGESVTAVADGIDLGAKTVSSGAVSLSSAASVVHVGYEYSGELKTLPIDVGGVTGSALGKIKNLSEVIVYLRNAASPKLGTNLYRMEEADIRYQPSYSGQAAPLFDGTHQQSYDDNWDREKRFYLRHETPLPCEALGFETVVETADE